MLVWVNFTFILSLILEVQNSVRGKIATPLSILCDPKRSRTGQL